MTHYLTRSHTQIYYKLIINYLSLFYLLIITCRLKKMRVIVVDLRVACDQNVYLRVNCV